MINKTTLGEVNGIKLVVLNYEEGTPKSFTFSYMSERLKHIATVKREGLDWSDLEVDNQVMTNVVDDDKYEMK